MNLLVAHVKGQTLIFEFAGESIPGVCQVVSRSYKKNGKWSYSTWEVELSSGLKSFFWSQDWEIGQYVTAGTWERAIADLQRRSGMPDLCPEAIERFIRVRLPETATKLDRAREEAKADPTEALQILLEAQAELVQVQTEIAQLEQAAQALEEAAVLRSKVAAARQAMAKGASLADLKALMIV